MDYNELIPAASDYDPHREILTKWLQVLLVCSMASLAMSFVVAIAGNGTVLTLISAAISIVGVVAYFGLAPVSERYRKAAIFTAISVGGSILVIVAPSVSIITLATSICSIVASWQEFNAHSEITESRDRKLSRQWHALFYYQLVIGIISGVLTTAAVVIAVLAELDPELIVNVTVWVVMFISAILGIVRILYLKRTLALFQEG